MKIKIQIDNKQLRQNLDKLERDLVEAAYNKALQDLGEKIGELSSDKVPLQEGILKSTFTVQKVGNEWVCGYNTEYAAYQHQGVRRDGSHIIRNRLGGGESFFLSGPVEQNRNQLLSFLGERFNFYLRKSISGMKI